MALFVMRATSDIIL